MATLASRQDAVFAGRFVIDREVGRGGVGVVYRARDQRDGAWIALKVIGAMGVDPAEEARFAREGHLLSSLDHPNIVKLVAWGNSEDGPYVAMEWLEGEDLAARMRRTKLSLGESLGIARQIAVALDAAHAADIVHRDIKPSNVFLLVSEDGAIRVKLVDFGVAANQDARLTRTGVVIGTPAYMAPEQARGDATVDSRADIYSLGATLFELIAGRPPHLGPTPIATLARLVTTDAPRLSQFAPEIPADLDDLVARMLATGPLDRPARAIDLVRELESLIGALPREAAALSSISPPSPTPGSLPPNSMDDTGPFSVSHPSTQGTRLVTSIVGMNLGSADRGRLLDDLRAQGAEAAPLGHGAVVAHLGVRKAFGNEAAHALDLGRSLAARGAQVGIATGRAQLKLSRPVGEVVDRAAGLAHTAESAQVLADTTTTELARGRFQFQVRSNGSALVGAPLRTRRGDAGGGAPFLGREAELAQIVAAYERCAEDETPIVVSVTGPPGIGKSRLGREVLARIGATSLPPKVILARCDPYGQGHPLGTAADVLRSLVGVTKGSSLELAAAAIAAREAARTGAHVQKPSGPTANLADELVSRLIVNESLPEGMDARGARDALWLSMTELLVNATTDDPTVLLLEDLQWSDADSIEWIDHVLGRAAGRPLFVLVLVRPAFWHGTGRFIGRDHVRIDLRPIGRRTAKAIARALLGEGADEATIDRIATQASGSPLFAEELARLVASGKSSAATPTIEAAIQVSLDALEDMSRDAVGRLSLYGLTAWDGGLAALGVRDPAPLLRQLAGLELLIEQAESRFKGTHEWVFKHALVREVAYNSLPPETRKRLHVLAARWLSEMGEDAARVAEHLQLGGDDVAAAQFWERAARRALATNALSDAVRMAERALMFAEDRPTTFARAQLLDEAFSRLDARAAERETSIRAMRDSVYDEASEVRASGAEARYDAARGVPGVVSRFAEVAKKASALGLVDEEARSLASFAIGHAYAGNMDAASAAAASLLDLCTSRGLPTAAIDAWQTFAVVHQTRGELGHALEARRNAARAAKEAGRQEREATLTMNVGFALTTIGAREEARAAIDAGLALAEAIGSAGTVRHGRMVLLGWAASFGGEPLSDPALVALRADADSAASGSWVSRDRSTLGVLFYRACELLAAGAHGADLKNARSLLSMSAAAYRDTDNRDILPVALGLWAEAERRAGDPERARTLASEAAALLDRGAPSLLNEASIFIALHDALLDLGEIDAAKEAVARGVPFLLRRLRGLAGTDYPRTFLRQLAPNVALSALLDRYGLAPNELRAALAGDPTRST